MSEALAQSIPASSRTTRRWRAVAVGALAVVVFLLGVWIIWYTGRRAARVGDAATDVPGPEHEEPAPDGAEPGTADETPKSQDVG